MNQIEVTVIEDSVTKKGNRLTTLQLKYHRFFHAEVMTHRQFSRNASSSRAIPVKKMLAQVWNDPAMPIQWGGNIAGMQAGAELPAWKRKLCSFVWRTAGKAACVAAWSMMKLGLHKQWSNRVLEPWQFIHVILSSTEWENFFGLRDHPDAQPELQVLAQMIKVAMAESTPRLVKVAEWHLPYLGIGERAGLREKAQKMASSRCCRVSYLRHDGQRPSIDDDLELFNKLTKSRPIHASPFEHVARPYVEGIDDPADQRNFKGWVQYRAIIEKSIYAS